MEGKAYPTDQTIGKRLRTVSPDIGWFPSGRLCHPDAEAICGVTGSKCITPSRQFQRSGITYRELQPASPEVALAIVWREGDPSVVLQSFLGTVREVSALPKI
jgi:hypothetical protein